LLIEQQNKQDSPVPNGHPAADDDWLDLKKLDQFKMQDSQTQKKFQLTDSNIIGSSLTFLLAGYETTSNALANTCWLLAKHPDIQRKLQNEIDANAKFGEKPNYELLHKMPYLDAVFRETLRLFSIVTTFIVRTCVNDCEINGYKFLRGMQVMLPSYSIHHDEEIWPEPEKFSPERFLNNPNLHPMAWTPFGSGPRNCVGMRFAELEYKLCLFQLLAKFNVELSDKSETTLARKHMAPLLVPQNGVWVKVSKRDIN